MNVSSTHTVSTELVEEIVRAIQTIDGYGSIELYVQNSVVTQITIRNIKKTSVSLKTGSTIIQKTMRVSV